MIPLLLYQGNTSVAVGTEDKPKHTGDKVIKEFALHRIRMGFTVGARCIAILPAAASHLTPSGLSVVDTAWAFALNIRSASTAV